MRASGRNVLVMGATGRLGVAIARALTTRGDRVHLTARSEERLLDLSAELAKCGEKPQTIPVDLSKPNAPECLVDELRGRNLAVDDVVLACGPFPRTPFGTLVRSDLENALTVHAVAPLLIVQLLASDLTNAQGAVVALTDAGVTRPFPNHVAYLTAKGAVQSGLRALAEELAPDVRVNMVALGIVSDPEADSDPLRTHRLATRSRLGRFGTPEEVTHVVLSLLDSTWATGEIWGIGR